MFPAKCCSRGFFNSVLLIYLDKESEQQVAGESARPQFFICSLIESALRGARFTVHPKLLKFSLF